MDDDILFGNIYVPPLHSRFFSNDVLKLLENDVVQKSIQNDMLYLCGDCNAQTADLDDLLTADDFLHAELDSE